MSALNIAPGTRPVKDGPSGGFAESLSRKFERERQADLAPRRGERERALKTPAGEAPSEKSRAAAKRAGSESDESDAPTKAGHGLAESAETDQPLESPQRDPGSTEADAGASEAGFGPQSPADDDGPAPRGEPENDVSGFAVSASGGTLVKSAESAVKCGRVESGASAKVRGKAGAASDGAPTSAEGSGTSSQALVEQKPASGGTASGAGSAERLVPGAGAPSQAPAASAPHANGDTGPHGTTESATTSGETSAAGQSPSDGANPAPPTSPAMIGPSSAPANGASPGDGAAVARLMGSSPGAPPGAGAEGAGLSDGGAGAGSKIGTRGARSDEMTKLDSLVARGLGASLAQRGGTLTLRLLPESLGSMRIQMEILQGAVKVEMEVGNAEAHRLLSQSLEGLRASLEARGLAVEKLGVSLTPSHASVLAAASGSAQGGAGGQGGNPSPGTGDTGAPRQDAGSAFGNHDAGDGRSRSWLGGDQRDNHRPGGAGPRSEHRTDADGPAFGNLWQRLRLGVDTRV